MPSVELLTAFAAAPSGKRAAGVSYQELLEAMQADPRVAAERLKALLKHPKAGVRAWACIVGAKVCGRQFVPTLLEAFNDRSQEVREMALSGLEEIDPELQLLHPLMLQMRQRLSKWDGDGGFRLARLLTALNDSEAAPYIARFAQRRDVDAYDRARSEVYVVYLTEGLEGVLSRIRNHADHGRMDILCKVAFFVGSPEVEPALEELIATAPDERCRAIAQQTLDALRGVRSEGPPPYWNRRLNFKSLPRNS